MHVTRGAQSSDLLRRVEALEKALEELRKELHPVRKATPAKPAEK